MGRGTRPTRHSFRAAAGADADLGRSAPAHCYMAPGSLRRGLVKLSKNKFTRRVFRRSLNLLQRAFYPHNTQGISPPLARDTNLRRKSNGSLRFRHSVGQPGKGKRKENGLGVVPTPFLSTESTEENRLSPAHRPIPAVLVSPRESCLPLRQLCRVIDRHMLERDNVGVGRG